MIKDSGNRREFESGAVRDIVDGKGRCDLLPLDIVAEGMQDEYIEYLSEFAKTGDFNQITIAIWRFCVGVFDNIESGMLEVAKHFEEGAKKYGERNWEKGIPTHCYFDSAVRHYLKWRRGDKDEPHDRAFVWNLMCMLWTINNRPECVDFPLLLAKKEITINTKEQCTAFRELAKFTSDEMKRIKRRIREDQA